MSKDLLLQELENSLFPREFKPFFYELTADEKELLASELIKYTHEKRLEYNTFCEKTIDIALIHIGKNPNLEYLAANIAYEIRRLEELQFLARMSENYFVLLPYIKGLVAQDSLSRAAANIRIVETKIKSDNLLYQIEFYLVKAHYAIANGDLTEALFLILSAKEFLESIEDELEILEVSYLTAKLCYEESNILLQMGRYEKAFELINHGLTIAKRIGNRFLTCLFEISLGKYNIEFKNDIEAGNQHHSRAAFIARRLMNSYLIALTLETIGTNLKLQNKFDEGIKYCKHAEKLYRKIGDEQNRRLIAAKIASFYISFGEISTALRILKELEDLGSRDPTTYLNLIYAHIQIDELDLAELYLERARKFLRGRGDLQGEFLLIYYEGLIEFQSGNFGKAEMLFMNAQEFAELSKLSQQALLASIQFLNVLVSKNIAFPSKRNFIKAFSVINELNTQLSKRYHPHEYYNVDFLKAILLFSNKNYNESSNIFTSLKEHYLELNQKDKLAIINDYLERLTKLQFIEEPVPSRDVIDRYPSSSFVPKPESMDEDELATRPLLLLILSEGGLPLYSHYFAEGNIDIDETLVSGFLGAVVSFTEKIGTRRIYGEDDNLNRGFLQGIRHGNFEILLERTENYIIALVAEKESYLLRKQLRKLAEELNVLFLMDEESIIVLGEKNQYYIQSLINKLF
ncbi:MAG: hypothetical protein FK734_03650 [Asgard group archaeon]|nr:hypothetical protein [Asgard group archaeon]